MNEKLKGKIAVVTGGGSGIGREVCLRLASEGAILAIMERDLKNLSKLKEKLEELQYEYWADAVDIQEEPLVEEFIKQTVDKFGKIDILVNAAGILGPMSVTTEDLSSQHWKDTLDINLIGTFYTIKYVIPIMKETGGGSIINFASTAGLNPIDGAAPYCVSKAGVIMLTKVVAHEYGKDGIRVNSICPDSIDTAMTRAVISHLENKGLTGVRENLPAGTLLNRTGKPEEVASLVLFLASEEDSGFITGSNTVIDGGSSIK